MKNRALVSSKVKSKKLKCRLLQFLFVDVRVNISTHRRLFKLQWPDNKVRRFKIFKLSPFELDIKRLLKYPYFIGMCIIFHFHFYIWFNCLQT